MTVQRLGTASRLLFYPETTWNTDPGSPVGYVLPLNAQAGFGSSDNLIEAPVFTGDMLPFSVINGMIKTEGPTPLGLEYETSGYLWKAFLGANGYLRPGGGTTTLHQFFIPTIAGSTPGSGQLQSEFLESPAQYIRGRGVRVGGFNYQTNLEGVAQYSCDFMGSGSEVVGTDLAGTKTDNGYSASNYFNGQVIYTSSGVATTLADMTALTFAPTVNLTRQDVAFNGGIAGSINAGNVNAKGKLEIIFGAGGSGPASNLSMYNDAVSQLEVQLDFLWANGPLATCTKFKRVQLTALRMARMAPRPGGAAGLKYSQDFQLVRSSNAKVAGEALGPNLGTYAVVGATNDKLGIKVDGGSTLTVTLTAGGARTAAQVVSDINALGSFASVGIATVFCGRVLITSKSTGSTSSIQIDTAVANSGHALFGFDNVVRTGKDNCPMLVTLFNSKNTSY